MTTKSQTQETLDILQEECAEVIQEVSKCRRFGIDSLHYKTNISHGTMLENEIGDILAMIDLLVDQGVIDINNLELAKQHKKEKLKQWSKIFEE